MKDKSFDFYLSSFANRLAKCMGICVKKVWNIFRYCLIFLLLVILIVNLYFIGARMLGGQENPKLFGFFYSIALSGSMEPEFSAGDVVLYQQQKEYKVGDVVMFHHGDSLVTHRITGESETGMITRGDANNTEDTDKLNKEQIEGKMIGVIPNLGDFLLFLRTPLGSFMLIVIGLLFLEGPRITEKLFCKKYENQ